jgi:hypothetical protein
MTTWKTAPAETTRDGHAVTPARTGQPSADQIPPEQAASVKPSGPMVYTIVKGANVFPTFWK